MTARLIVNGILALAGLGTIVANAALNWELGSETVGLAWLLIGLALPQPVGKKANA